VCIFPTTTNSDAHIFPTMHFPHNVSLVRIGVCVCVCVCVCCLLEINDDDDDDDDDGDDDDDDDDDDDGDRLSRRSRRQLFTAC